MKADLGIFVIFASTITPAYRTLNVAFEFLCLILTRYVSLLSGNGCASGAIPRMKRSPFCHQVADKLSV